MLVLSKYKLYQSEMRKSNNGSVWKRSNYSIPTSNRSTPTKSPLQDFRKKTLWLFLFLPSYRVTKTTQRVAYGNNLRFCLTILVSNWSQTCKRSNREAKYLYKMQSITASAVAFPSLLIPFRIWKLKTHPFQSAWMGFYRNTPLLHTLPNRLHCLNFPAVHTKIYAFLPLPNRLDCLPLFLIEVGSSVVHYYYIGNRDALRFILQIFLEFVRRHLPHASIYYYLKIRVFIAELVLWKIDLGSLSST
jgi:hypothetical protein